MPIKTRGLALDASNDPLTGNLTLADTYRYEGDEVRARDGGGLKLYNDDGVGLFVADGATPKAGLGTESPLLMFHLVGDGGDADILIDEYKASNIAPQVTLRKARGDVDTPVIVNNGDQVGKFGFQAHDGSAFREVAFVRAEIDGSPGANDTPGRLIFGTTPDGSTTPVERMRIDDAGNLILGKAATPSAKAHIDQASATGNVPVLKLDQADVDKVFVHFVGESAADNSQSIADAADLTTPGAVVAWVQVYLEDVAGAGKVADGVYWLPLHATPTA